MRKLSVASAALNQTPLDWNNNYRNIIAAIERAKSRNIELLTLPELCITGYGCEDLFGHHSTSQRAWKMLQEVLPQTEGIAVAIGLPVLHARKTYNCVAMLANQELLGLYAKQNLAGEGLHYEPRWFTAWKPGCVAHLDGSRHATSTTSRQMLPIGDLCFTINGVKLGFEICEDAWVAHRPGSRLAQRAVDGILNPSASHFAFGKQAVRTSFVAEGSRAFNAFYVYANLLGNESGRAVYDGDCLIAAGGSVLARAPRFSFLPWTMTEAVIDVDAQRRSALRSVSFRTEASDDPHCVIAEFPVKDTASGISSAEYFQQSQAPAADDTPILADGLASSLPAWEECSTEHKKFEEFSRAVALALHDYLRKSRMNGYCISLSGGADSGAACVLVDTMAKLGSLELGLESYLASLSHIPGLDAENYRAQLLQTVYLPTRNSSERTLHSAQTIAQLCGARFASISVDAIFQANIAAVEQYLGRELSWEDDDIALQNLGARSRPTLPWAIANINRLLFLNTSNRSEAAVGYCTMDGDTSGAINPIGGIDKAFLLNWLVWMQKQGPEGLAPLAQLAELNSLSPSAELRPQAQEQSDEKDLMPYPVLNRIEQLFAVSGLSPVEIYTVLQEEFSGHQSAQLKEWIAKFFRLCARAQWKRERLAMSFHLDDHNLDPKTWFRFPILNRGFEVELDELSQL